MQNLARDLWPDDINQPADIQTPASILKEQATLLGQKTKNLVEGQVTTNSYTSDYEATGFTHTFYLVAPALGGYKYGLLTVYHPIELYPVDIHFDNRRIKADSREEFVELLKELFADNKTKTVIHSLIAQSQS